LVMVICREVIHQLELAQDSRQLSTSEHNLIKHLKSRILGLAAVEKRRAHQKIKDHLDTKGRRKYQIFPPHG
jgi:hypothetical protein